MNEGLQPRKGQGCAQGHTRVGGRAIPLLGTAVLGLLLSQLLPVKAPEPLRKAGAMQWVEAAGSLLGLTFLFTGCFLALCSRPDFLFTGCFLATCRALSKTPAALALNQTQHCKQLEGLVSAQVQLCRSNLELMHTIVHAAREVMKACRRAFADMRWNCSSIELAPNYLLDLERGRGPAGPARACGMREGRGG